MNNRTKKNKPKYTPNAVYNVPKNNKYLLRNYRLGFNSSNNVAAMMRHERFNKAKQGEKINNSRSRKYTRKLTRK